MACSGVGGRGASIGRGFAALIVPLVWVLSCTPSPEPTSQRSSAVKRANSVAEGAEACCKRRHSPGPFRTRCVSDADHGRGECCRNHDAGHDVSAAVDAPSGVDAAGAADSRADAPDGVDAPAGVDATVDNDASGAGDSAGPECIAKGANCDGSAACCTGAACVSGVCGGVPACVPQMGFCRDAPCCAGLLCDSGSLTCIPHCIGEGGPCVSGFSCCSGQQCAKDGFCPFVTCTPGLLEGCAPQRLPKRCCSTSGCFPAPSAFCPCIADGFSCNPCCGGAGCLQGLCEPVSGGAGGADGGSGTDAPEVQTHCPDVTIQGARPTVLPVSGTTVVTAPATDIDGADVVTQTWSIVGGNASLSQPATGPAVSVTCLAAGNVAIQVDADDGRGPAAMASECPASTLRIEFSCGPVTCAGSACDDTNPCCPGTGCQNGSCAECVGLLANCNAAPCCPGFACGAGACRPTGPACRPVGGLCDATHPCCGGVSCNANICGNACGGTGTACDDLHPCCDGDGCISGICMITRCVPRDEPCIAQDCCLGTAVCQASQGLCRLPGCGGGGCGPRVLGCVIPGFVCRLDSECCSGLCGNGRCV